MAIDPVTTLALTAPVLPAAPSTSSGQPPAAGFGDVLKEAINTVESSAGDANDAITRMIDGRGDVHEAMIAMQRADTLLQLTVQVRNKLVQAYQDLMRMPT